MSFFVLDVQWPVFFYLRYLPKFTSTCAGMYFLWHPTSCWWRPSDAKKSHSISFPRSRSQGFTSARLFLMICFFFKNISAHGHPRKGNNAFLLAKILWPPTSNFAAVFTRSHFPFAMVSFPSDLKTKICPLPLPMPPKLYSTIMSKNPTQNSAVPKFSSSEPAP